MYFWGSEWVRLGIYVLVILCDISWQCFFFLACVTDVDWFLASLDMIIKLWKKFYKLTLRKPPVIAIIHVGRVLKPIEAKAITFASEMPILAQNPKKTNKQTNCHKIWNAELYGQKQLLQWQFDLKVGHECNSKLQQGNNNKAEGQRSQLMKILTKRPLEPPFNRTTIWGGGTTIQQNCGTEKSYKWKGLLGIHIVWKFKYYGFLRIHKLGLR